MTTKTCSTCQYSVDTKSCPHRCDDRDLTAFSCDEWTLSEEEE